jgi:hypothetical protein
MSSFIYSKDNEGWLVIVRDDFAEMTKVDLFCGKSKYIRFEAPVAVVRQSVKNILGQGYKLMNQIDLRWKPFIDC